jgi:hypothetical protein
LTAAAAGDVLFQADLDGVHYRVEGPAHFTVPTGQPFAITICAEPAGFQGGRPLQIVNGSVLATLVVPDAAVAVTAVPQVTAYYPELHLPDGAQAAEGWQPLKVRSEMANKAWKLVHRTARQLLSLIPGVGPILGISRFVADVSHIALDQPEDWLSRANFENTYDTFDYPIPPWDGSISAFQVKWFVQLEPSVTAAVPVTLVLQFSTQRTPLFLSSPRGAKLAVELPAPKPPKP